MKVMLSANSVQLTEELKKAEKAQDNFKKKVKETKDESKASFGAIKDIAGNALSSLTGGLSDTVTGFASTGKGVYDAIKGFKLLKVAISATGFGALALILGSVIQYFSGTQAGSEKLKVIFKQVGAVVGQLFTRLKALGAGFLDVGKAIGQFIVAGVKLSTFDFKGAFDAAKKGADSLKDAYENVSKAGSGIADGFKDAIARGKEIGDRENKLARDKVDATVKQAQLELIIAESQRKAKDKQAFDDKQRFEFQNKAIEAQKELSELLIGLAQEELAIKKLIDENDENKTSDYQETANLQAQLLKLQADENNKIKGLVEERQAINSELETELKNKQKIFEEERKREKEKADALKLFLEEQKESYTPKQDREQLYKDLENAFKEMGQRIEDVLPKDAFDVLDEEQLSEELQKVEDELSEKNAKAVKLAEDTSAIVTSLYVDAFSLLGESLGNLMSGDANGLASFLDGIIGLLSDYCRKFGQLLIVASVGAQKLKNIVLSPVEGIAAGIALIAASAAIKKLSPFGNSSDGGIGKTRGFANGGTIPGPSSGRFSVVGERGMELIENSAFAGSRVYNNSDSMKMLSGGANKVQFELIGTTLPSGDIHFSLKEYERRKGLTR